MGLCGGQWLNKETPLRQFNYHKHVARVTGELGPQEKSVRGDLGPLVNSVQVNSVRSCPLAH